MSEVIQEVVKLSLELDDYSNYYSHADSCGNCGHRNQCYILKGRSLKGLEMNCSRCSCAIAFKRFDGDSSR